MMASVTGAEKVVKVGGTHGAKPNANSNRTVALGYLWKAVRVLAGALVIGVLVWQAVAAHGNPDPTIKGMNYMSKIFSTGVLVFREGLEAILVLAAITAGMSRGRQKAFLNAVPAGAGAGLLATLLTWFVIVAIISAVNAPELSVQAGTGLLAIVVLLVVMNWFFHKVYWTGWIVNHSSRRKRILEADDDSRSRTFLGLAFLGFTAIYREGFEIVLFLQNLRLTAGNTIVLEGAAIGVGLTLIVAAITFVAHKRLPYRQMLIGTGVLLGFVLLVMVGENVQEMQQANWIPTHNLNITIPDWAGVWFSVFPNVESMVSQAAVFALVVGSYVIAPRFNEWQARNRKSTFCGK